MAPSFYIYDEDERQQTPPPPVSLLLLSVPIELTHSYSYAQLLPHSLALRLNVLKRSLQILKERPQLISLLVADEEGDDWLPPLVPTASNSLTLLVKSSFFKHRNNSQDAVASPPGPLVQNALLAALAAFLRPPIRRLDLFPVEKVLTTHKTRPQAGRAISGLHDSTQIADLIRLIQTDMDLDPEVASQLYKLSLSQNSDYSETVVREKLLYALATPFVENSQTTTALIAQGLNPPKSPIGNGLMLALTMLSPSAAPASASGARGIHSQAKRNTPQLVFTIGIDSPWEVKAANDLACLMFGVLKIDIKSLTLMDLIAPQFRDFVISRLNRCLWPESRKLPTLVEIAGKDIIFSGEVVAISRPGKKFAYTSIWAKRKGLLIICMFDQIPCDAFDVVVAEDGHIQSVKPLVGDLIDSSYQWGNVSDVLELVEKEMGDLNETLRVVNLTRYYTLVCADGDVRHHIPAAIVLNPIEDDDDAQYIKLKVHSLPYIAGMFVVDPHFTIKSCNNLIARNLFGQLASELCGNLLDMLIPTFTEIFKFGVDMSGVTMSRGLVLPEHFFRKFDAVVRSLKADPPTPDRQEEMFFSSLGLAAVHRDGSTIYVDVQVRVPLLDTYVVWVTYSRPGGQVRGSGARGESLPVAVVPPSPAPLPTISEKSALDTIDSAYEPPQLLRNSLVRKAKAGLFAFPVRYISDSIRNKLRSDDTQSPTPEVQDVVPAPMLTLSLVNPIHHYTEAELIRLENEHLEEVKRQLKLWPREIGTARRTKKFSEFTVEKEMGEGAYGKVVLAHHKDDANYRVIIKCIDKEKILVDTWVRDRKLGTIPSEIQIMNTLNAEPHPNIMKIVDFFEDRKYYYLETPIFGNPPAIDLFDYIEIKSDMTEDECRFIFRQICSLIYHLHKHGIVHRDIKDENVIVDENGIVKLIDFGLAGYTKQGPFDVFVGTIDYALPEVLKGDKYEGKPQDIWALGILLYTMLYKENPFYNVDEIMEGDLRIPYVVLPGSLALVKRILTRDINQRPSITDIVEDKWLQE